MSPWKTVRSEVAPDGAEVEMKYAEFGKGKWKTRQWKIYRNGEYAGYAAIAADADMNFDRVLSGYVRNPSTGRYEKAGE